MSKWFAMATVLLQIAYPLTDGQTRVSITVASVATFFAASVTHALESRSIAAAAAVVVVCCGIGLASEAIGIRTGFPFGEYTYADTLGAKVLGVPLAVAAAWAMVGWPALLAGRRAGHPVLVGAALLVTWDLFLDPQMVDAGHWAWVPSSWPDLHGIPLSNTIGWAAVATVMMAVLHRVAPEKRRSSDAVPFVLLGWTWFSETVGHLAFFGRPTVGLVGGISMGAALMAAVRGARR